jgi:hypothetical protein
MPGPDDDKKDKVVWGKTHRKELAELFQAKLANPKSTKPDEIDAVKAMSKKFEKIKDVNFRKNFKNCAAEWMMEQALKGIRRREFVCDCYYFDIL